MLSRRGFLAASAAVTTGCVTFGSGSNGSDTRATGSDAPLPTAEDRYLAYSLDEYAANKANSPASKDSIPSIDDPVFDEPDGDFASTLSDGEVVFGVEMNGETRAYPQRIVVHHEVVNDVVGGENVSVTYCPLTGTAMGYKRGGTTFGVEGFLVNSNLVLFDRATDSRFPQVIGVAVEGPRRDDALKQFPVFWTTWSRWRDEHPDTLVLTDDTGYVRNYDRDPYGSYSFGPYPDPAAGYYVDEDVLYPLMNNDDSFGSKEVFVCARDSEREEAVAFRKESLRGEDGISIDTEKATYAATYDEALGAASIERDGESLVSFDAMWFAWAAFYPETEVRG